MLDAKRSQEKTFALEQLSDQNLSFQRPAEPEESAEPEETEEPEETGETGELADDALDDVSDAEEAFSLPDLLLDSN
jgi:hypothetical protein